ncbi:MAG: hypothetical protein Q8J69_06240 [Sphingobacteriaceae bacterium]|nr:hypothetical protein [Sphingobacteriaceae bacterium]
MGKTVVIQITNDQVLLSPGINLPIAHTNIPVAHLRFSSHNPIYWEVEQLSFDAAAGELRVRVVDYESRKVNLFKQQAPKKAIYRLLFEKFDWLALQRQLTSFQKSMLQDYMDNLETHPFSYQISKIVPPKKITPVAPPTAASRQKVVFAQSLKWPAVQLKMGYAECRVDHPHREQEVVVRVNNDFLLPEFETIKAWFAKKLQRKRVDVVGSWEEVDGQIENLRVKSEVIGLIGPDLIESIRYQRSYALTKAPSRFLPDKSLFTTDDIFDAFEDSLEGGNVFGQEDADILQFLLEKSEVRNKKQLAFLASQQLAGEKLRYSLHPNFGFLFVLEGENCRHFIWELLNSHATYLWSIEKTAGSITAQWQRVEAVINSIRTQGREAYKQSYRAEVATDDLIFNHLPHEKSGSDFVDHFPRWRHRLLEHLV